MRDMRRQKSHKMRFQDIEIRQSRQSLQTSSLSLGTTATLCCRNAFLIGESVFQSRISQQDAVPTAQNLENVAVVLVFRLYFSDRRAIRYSLMTLLKQKGKRESLCEY